MDTGTWWRMPPLTTRGQTAFWDAQAEGYEAADMTNDNSGELEIVLEKSREIMCDDIITLGGAVGCRDPKVILEDMLAQGKARTPKVVFNDLSEQQTRKAVEILKPVTDLGVAITFAPGEIRNVCGHIPPAPRRLILGVYHSDAFFKSEPAAGLPDGRLRRISEEPHDSGGYVLHGLGAAYLPWQSVFSWRAYVCTTR